MIVKGANAADLFALPEFTRTQVADAGYTRCVCIINDLVYDLTDFLDIHPGGAEIIYEMVSSSQTFGTTRKFSFKFFAIIFFQHEQQKSCRICKNC